ncbi:MAG: cellulase family glycosylhydrolase, partial [Microlunatus sp.]|nr:cellulase family glycosylhydrolase [Microlunatus sp.]
MQLPIRRAVTAVAAAAALVLATAAPAAHASGAQLDPAQFRGVNWADPRDNFASDPVVPSGLSTADTPKASYQKAHAILLGFRQNLDANTVRLPVNPYSVGPDSAWWADYSQVIKAASDLDFHVILAYWEGPGALDDGFVDDPAAWWSMWDTLTSTYARNPQVNFEPMNEPHGYTATDWVGLVSQWLGRYSSIPRNRVFVDGNGYADHLSDVCS